MNDALKAHKPTIGPWSALLLFIAVFAGVYVAVKAGQARAMLHFDLSNPRAMVAFRASGSILLIWVEVAALYFLLKLRGQRFANLGWRKRAPVWGWLAAAIAFAIYAGFSFSGPMLKGAPFLTDWSAFRILTALGIGITAGFGEELIFRGFVMTGARDGGAPTWVQVLLSALLFGIAHGGWGGMTANFSIGSMIGAIAGTSILGLMLALVYVASKRSLMPAMFAHGLIDLVIEPWLMLFAVSGGFERLHP